MDIKKQVGRGRPKKPGSLPNLQEDIKNGIAVPRGELPKKVIGSHMGFVSPKMKAMGPAIKGPVTPKLKVRKGPPMVSMSETTDGNY